MKDQRGYSLPLVLVILAVISSLALAAARQAMGARDRAAGFAERIRTRHAALSGIDIGKRLLAADRTPWDGPGDAWFDGAAFALNDAAVSVEIIDEQAAIPLNHLLLPSGETNPPFERAVEHLFPGVSHPGERWREFLSNHFMNGPVKPVSSDVFAAFLEQFPGSGAATNHADDRIARYLTSYGQGRINLNTASPEILRALGGESLERAVINRRNTRALETVLDIDDTAGSLRGLISVTDVRSAFFRVRATATGVVVTCRAEAVVWRGNNRLTVLRHREWWS